MTEARQPVPLILGKLAAIRLGHVHPNVLNKYATKNI
jgi:hypothetical protein